VWRHGGVAFAPKPRDYRVTLNKKTRRIAMKSALSAKAADSAILVIDNLHVDEIKTKPFAAFLTKVGAAGKPMVITAEVDDKLVKSARNIPGVTTTTATIISPYEIMRSTALVVDKAALQKIEEVFA
jgi:large subunit ribosomal protein L4